MEQLLTFIADHPILVGAFAVVLAALIATESARLTRRWKEVDTAQAILMINRRDPLILDVSNSADFAKGHIINAEHMPPSRIESGNAQLLKKKSQPVLVYCKNGQVSPQMAKRLVQLGFEDVSVLRGGLAQWTGDQQPVSRGKPARSKGGRQGKRDKGKRDKGNREKVNREQANREQGGSKAGRKAAGQKASPETGNGDEARDRETPVRPDAGDGNGR